MSKIFFPLINFLKTSTVYNHSALGEINSSLNYELGVIERHSEAVYCHSHANLEGQSSCHNTDQYLPSAHSCACTEVCVAATDRLSGVTAEQVFKRGEGTCTHPLLLG